jgi:hypothetical protein
MIASQIHDIFLSHAASDRGLSTLITTQLSDAGLSVFSLDDVIVGEAVIQEMRKALAECSAVVIVLTRSTLHSPSMPFEVGAAMALSKPVFVLYDGVSTEEIPKFMQELHVSSVADLPTVIETIQKSREPLTDNSVDVLRDVYVHHGVPTDMLMLDPSSLHDLAVEFNQQSGNSVSGQRLLQELIRMRKRSRLPRIKKN